MTRTAEVVVVGSGIIGASIAYQLARHGVSNVIALDKGKGPSEGSTGASSSVIRCKYSNPPVVRLAFHGQESYGNWKEFTGLTEPRSGLQQLGVLWMMGHSASDVEADAAMLVSQGVSARSHRSRRSRLDVPGTFRFVGHAWTSRIPTPTSAPPAKPSSSRRMAATLIRSAPTRT